MIADVCRKDFRTRFALVAVAVILGLSSPACASRPPREAAREANVVRIGADRGIRGYAEREPAAKKVLLRRINTERRAYGLRELSYDLLGAKVGDEFCLDSAATGSVGHWDTRGRAPYLRWALAGGVDFHGENFASESRTGHLFKEKAEELLLAVHARFMAERPPHDGHRRAVLDSTWTHVGIGFAVVGGELRMTEEFSRRVLDWVEVPAGPVRAGSAVPFTAQLPPGWKVSALEVAHEPPPKPLSVAAIARRGAYGYPKGTKTLRPYPPAGSSWSDGDTGSFPSQGRFSVHIPLDKGKGNYYILVFAGEGSVAGRSTTPVAAPLIRAD